MKKIGQRISTEMGGWKYEGFEKVCYYLAPKLYSEGKIRKAKGVQAKKVNFPKLLQGPLIIPRQGLTGARSSVLKGRKVDRLKSSRKIQKVFRGKRIMKNGVCVYENL